MEPDYLDLLSASARNIGAGTATDMGFAWALPTAVENPIVLSAGIPDPESLPVEDLQVALEEVLRTTRKEALRYGGVLGFEGLRRELADRSSQLDGMGSGAENFLIGNGSAGCIDTICTAFLDPGDVVIVEGPTFSGSTRTFLGHQAEVIQAPVDEKGLVVDQLPTLFQQAKEAGKRVKLLYTVCDFQNPTGTVLPEERRARLVEICQEHQTIILEDTAYAELFFRFAPPQSLYGIAKGKGVLKVGTFSKIIAPGLRVGWIQGAADLVGAVARVKFDMGNSPLLQRAVERYLQSGKVESHIAGMRALYAQKCQTLAASLEQHCPMYFRFQKPEGGFYLWVKCIGPEAHTVRQEAAKEGVVFPPGSAFFLNRENDDTTHLRMAFSTATLSELEQVGPLLKVACDRAVGER